MSNEVDVWAKLVELHPELTNADFDPQTGTIFLQNDSDGFGTYIVKWEHPSIEQPTDEALGITRKPAVIEAEVVEEAVPTIELPEPTEMPVSDVPPMEVAVVEEIVEPPAPVIEEPLS